MADAASAPNPRPFWIPTQPRRPRRTGLSGPGGVRPGATPRPLRPERRLEGRVILVVDDDWDARQIVQTVLQHYGARVLTAASALEGLRLLGTIEPSALLLDLRMPGLDGFDLIRRLRADRRWAKLPIVALTALGSSADYLRTLTHGFDAHLTKPVEDDALVSVLDRLIREKAGA